MENIAIGIYKAVDGNTKPEVRFQDINAWLMQQQIAVFSEHESQPLPISYNIIKPAG